MKFLLALCVCVLVVATFAEDGDKKVDKRHIVVGFDWPYFDSRIYHYYHGILKRDTSAHSIQKRDVPQEDEPKSEQKRDLVLGYGAYPYYGNYPYYAGYRSYPYFDYYNYGRFY